MANNYQRHAQGRRFESKNFGDMGLRAYRDQQQTIINAMKLQAAQYKDVHDEYLSGTIDKARKERENRAELKKLEDDLYDAKFLNKKIRADREIDQLRAQAEDHGKRAEFWKDFSSTYAKHYMEAFESVSSAIDLKYAEKIHAKNTAVGEDGLSPYDKAIRNSKTLYNIASTGLINETDKFYTDPKNNGHYKRTQHAHALDIEKRSSHNYNLVTADKLIGDSDKIITHMRDTLEGFDPKNPQRGFKITKENIQGLVQQRSLEIIANLGMDPNSKGGKKFLDHMWKVAGEELDKEEGNHKVKEDQDNLIGKDGLVARARATVKEKDGIDFEITINHMVKHHQNRWITNNKGEPVFQELNVKEATLATYELLINEGIIDRWNMDKLNIPYPGQPMPISVIDGTAKDERKLMFDRHPDLVDSIESAILKKEEEDFNNKTKKDELEDNAELTKVKLQFENGEIDPNNLDDLKILEQAHRDNPKTREFIQNAALFNPTHSNTDGFLVNQSINEAYKNNDYKTYTNTMQYLGKEQRTQFNTFTKHLDEMNTHGASASQLKKRMEGHIKDDLEISDVSTRTHATAGPMSEAMIQDFYYQYRIIANDKKYTSPQARIEAAYEKVFKRYKDGEGIYRKKTGSSGKQTVFAAMVGVTEPDTSLESESPQEQDELIAKGWENIFTQAGSDTAEPLEVLDQDYLDRNLRNAINGRNIEQNDMIDKLYLTQPQGAKMLSKTQIFNKYLEAKNISTRVPAGPLDHAEFVALNTKININNFNKLSDENKMRMKTYLETGVMTNVKPKDVQSLEKNNEVRQNFNLGGPQYSRTEVKNMNKSGRPWWYSPALFGDHYYKNK